MSTSKRVISSSNVPCELSKILEYYPQIKKMELSLRDTDKFHSWSNFSGRFRWYNVMLNTKLNWANFNTLFFCVLLFSLIIC